MGLHGIDFLSAEPKSFIFHRSSNKTNLGGVLSLIYLLVFLGISLSYIVFYQLEDDYSIQYLYQEKILSYEESEEMKRNEKYNPFFTFNISLKDGYSDDDVGERFMKP